MVSKKEWLAKSLIDLKGKPLSSLNFISGIEKEYTPFFHREDAVDLSIPASYTSDVLLSETINVIDFKVANLLLNEALIGGINAPVFTFNKAFDNDDLSVLFKGIELTFIQPFFILDINQDVGVLTRFLEDKIMDKAQFKGGISREGSNVNLQPDWPNAKLTFITSQQKNLSDQLQELIEKAITHFISLNQEDRKNAYQQMEVSLTLTRDFYNSICHLRALKMLLAHVQKSFGLSTDAIFSINVNHQVGEQEVEGKMLIDASHSALMGYLGGATRINLTISRDSLDKHDAPFLTNVSRNIHHLFNYESQLTGLQDPAQGSYALDNITRDIAQNIWEII